MSNTSSQAVHARCTCDTSVSIWHSHALTHHFAHILWARIKQPYQIRWYFICILKLQHQTNESEKHRYMQICSTQGLCKRWLLRWPDYYEILLRIGMTYRISPNILSCIGLYEHRFDNIESESFSYLALNTKSIIKFHVWVPNHLRYWHW